MTFGSRRQGTGAARAHAWAQTPTGRTASPKGERWGFWTTSSSAADQVATRAKEGVDDVQAKRNLQRAYEDLGKTAFQLIEEDELSHPRLTARPTRCGSSARQLPPERTGEA